METLKMNLIYELRRDPEKNFAICIQSITKGRYIGWGVDKNGEWIDQIHNYVSGSEHLLRPLKDNKKLKTQFAVIVEKKYGKNWRDVKLEKINPSNSNKGAYTPSINIYSHGGTINNTNGYIFINGVWTRTLEEAGEEKRDSFSNNINIGDMVITTKYKDLVLGKIIGFTPANNIKLELFRNLNTSTGMHYVTRRPTCKVFS